MKKTILKKYAELIAKCGINVQKGQDVIITAELDQPEFVKYVVEECYKAGARKVSVEWHYQPLVKLHTRYQKESVLSHPEDWEIEKLKHAVDTLPARIYLESEDPDGLKGVKQPKYSNALQKKSLVVKPFRDKMDNKYQWCIAAVPGKAWAKKVFPNLGIKQAEEKLWQAILYTARIDDDPIAAWDKHNKTLASKCNYLNSLELEYLHFKSELGTDLKVGLIKDALFLSGREATLNSGIFYNPNIPTEEVFTTPKSGCAEGVIFGSRPFSFQGQLIENFSIEFKNGKVSTVHAEKNEELLKTLTQMDAGASMLGECALVPKESPISQSGILFYNTLFDENAACHLALGEGFANCIKDYDKYTLEQCREKGINDSIIHEDFMIGTEDMSIDGITRSGKTVPIFRNGTWAF